MKASDLLVRCLEEEGIEYMFGVPGEENADFMMSLEESNTNGKFGNPEWKGLAQAFGWHGHFVANSVDLADTLETAFGESGPSLVVIPIDYRENPLLTKKLGDITATF